VPAPIPQLLVDVSGTPFGGAPTWTDLTGWLEFAGDAPPVQINLCGRNDEQTDDATSGGGSFTLRNPGFFTNGPLTLQTDMRVQVRLQAVAGGTVFTVADGYIDSCLPAFPGGGNDWSLLRVAFSDVTSRLGTAKPLLSMLEHEVLTDTPTAFYPMTEPSSSTTVGNIAPGAVGAAGSFVVSKGGGLIELGGDPLTADDASSVKLDASVAISFTPNPKGAAVSIPNALPGSGPFSLAFAFSVDQVVGGSTPQQTLLAAVRRDGSTSLVVAVDGLGGVRTYLSDDADNSGSGTNDGTPIGGRDYRDGLDHLAHLVYTGVYPGQYLRLYIDGALVPDYNELYGGLPALTLLPRCSLMLGAILPVLAGGSGFSYGMSGRVGMLGMWTGTALSAAQALRHYQAFVGFPGESSDTRYARVAGYGNVTTSGLPAGIARMGPQHIRGRTALEVLAEVARTEGTVSRATRAGALTFQARNRRYNPAVALALTNLDVGGDDTDVVVQADRQGLHNTRTVTRTTGSSQLVQDLASVAQRGTIDGGSLAVASSTDLDAYNTAKWRIATHLTDQLRVPALSIDLFNQPQAFVEAVLAVDLSDLLAISGLNPQNPGGGSGSWFFEGGQITVGADLFRLDLFTSPDNLPVTLRADAAPSAYTRLDAGLKIPF
jgi:hypothetical protein